MISASCFPAGFKLVKGEDREDTWPYTLRVYDSDDRGDVTLYLDEPALAKLKEELAKVGGSQ
jgi:hypothetical protein